MSRFKWLVIGCVVLWIALEGLLWGYRVLSRRARTGPPSAYVYDVEKYRESGGADILYEETGSLQTPFNQPRGIAAGPGGLLCVIGDNAATVLDGQGRERRRIELGGPPNCVAFDTATNLYVGLTDHIAVWQADGTNVAHWASVGENGLLTSIAVGGGSVFAADYGNRVVWRYDLDGRLLGVIGRRDRAKGQRGFILPSPSFDLLVSGDRLWVVNPGRTRVEEYDFDGTLFSHWGSPSMEIHGFCGCCNPSHIAMLADGRFVTSEKGLPRVKLYGGGGAFLGLVAGTDRFAADATGLDLAVDAQGRILVLDPSRRQVRIFTERD